MTQPMQDLIAAVVSGVLFGIFIMLALIYASPHGRR